jgi:hypothetical protein
MKITTKQYPKLVKLMKSVYPDYKGLKFYIIAQDKPFSTISYWDGGTRTYFTFIRADGNVLHQPNSSPWKQYDDEQRTAQLVPGLACVTHKFFCGHDCGLTIMFHPDDMPKQIEYLTNFVA